jgi:hypothetical protein
VYARRIADQEYTFGVSGLLYRSNVLMYDHQTESLWLQVKRQAVTGPMTGTDLDTIPSSVTSWAKWQKAHPSTKVLSLDTGYERDYRKDPYESYYRSRKGLFARFFKPVPGAEEKELVAGIVLGGQARAYPLRVLRERGSVTDVVAGDTIHLEFHKETDRVTARSGKGLADEPIVVYWFVWKGIHPETTLYRESAP